VSFIYTALPNLSSVTDIESKRKGQHQRSWETGSSQEVKELFEDDVSDYTIFDVVMPLPGFDVDLHRMRRDQRYVRSSNTY
jgi:hypothetical protein